VRLDSYSGRFEFSRVRHYLAKLRNE